MAGSIENVKNILKKLEVYDIIYNVSAVRNIRSRYIFLEGRIILMKKILSIILAALMLTAVVTALVVFANAATPANVYYKDGKFYSDEACTTALEYNNLSAAVTAASKNAIPPKVGVPLFF